MQLSIWRIFPIFFFPLFTRSEEAFYAVPFNNEIFQMENSKDVQLSQLCIWRHNKLWCKMLHNVCKHWCLHS
jgi:hypothetical protein